MEIRILQEDLYQVPQLFDAGRGCSMNDAQREQYRRLQDEVCPDTTPVIKGVSINPPHGLVRITARWWRDGFRKKTYWCCWFCELREEVVR